MGPKAFTPKRLPTAALALTLVVACSTGGGTVLRRSGPGSPPARMVASWYGEGLDGRRTANGESFDPEAFTCAHRELPFGTVLRLRNPDTGASVDVTVTDRGPFVRGRDLDVSRAAARRLGFASAGVADLEVEILEGGVHARKTRSSTPGVLGAGL